MGMFMPQWASAVQIEDLEMMVVADLRNAASSSNMSLWAWREALVSVFNEHHVLEALVLLHT